MFEIVKRKNDICWIFCKERYELHYDGTVLIRFIKDGDKCKYMSEALDIKGGILKVSSLDEAFDLFECMVVSHIENKLDYYNHMLTCFKGSLRD